MNACQCPACRWPTTENLERRIEHAARHAAFMDWQGDHPRQLAGVRLLTRSRRLQVIAQEQTVPFGACHEARHFGSLPHAASHR